MKPRLLLRRVSFWLGLFVACFLAWAWWDSKRFETSVHLGVGLGPEVMRVDGATFLVRVYRFRFDPVMRREPLVISEQQVERYFVENEFRYFKVPDSLVFFSFVGLWGGWLVWRWRSTERLATRFPR